MLAIASKAVSVSINDMVNMDMSKVSTMKELSKVKNFVICFDEHGFPEPLRSLN